MEHDELITTLSRHDPNPELVMADLGVKRRRRTRTRLLTGAGIVVCAIVAVSLILTQIPGPRPQPIVSSAGGCASVSMADTLATAKSAGASVVVATGVLTGQRAQDDLRYDAMALRSVRTLSGPPVQPGSVVWVSGALGPSGQVPGADAGALWAPDGQLFAIVWPREATGLTVGPTERIAPVVNGQVILSAAGCWDATGLPTRPFAGQLAEIPGSDSYARAAGFGFHAVALTTVEQLATR
jgi:hypothetical protein